MNREAPSTSGDARTVLLFDGVCSLCNAVVDLVMRHERAATVQFASLQSDAAAEMLRARLGEGRTRALRAERQDGSLADPDTVVLVVGQKVYTRSTAVLHLVRHLRLPWSLLQVGWLVPRPLRDALYGLVAKRRYAWFGQKETCRIPSPEERARFLG